MSQWKVHDYLCNVEESFEKFIDLGPGMDDF